MLEKHVESKLYVHFSSTTCDIKLLLKPHKTPTVLRSMGPQGVLPATRSWWQIFVALVCKTVFAQVTRPPCPLPLWRTAIKSLCDNLAATAFSVLDDWSKIVAMSAGCNHGQFHDLREVRKARSASVWSEENTRMTTGNDLNHLLRTRHAHTHTPYCSGYRTRCSQIVVTGFHVLYSKRQDGR